MTTVAGNVSKTTRNALQLLHFWNAEIPLAREPVPLVRARVMQHLYTVNREWLAMTLLNTTVSHWVYQAFLAIRDALMRAPGRYPVAIGR